MFDEVRFTQFRTGKNKSSQVRFGRFSAILGQTRLGKNRVRKSQVN